MAHLREPPIRRHEALDHRRYELGRLDGLPIFATKDLRKSTAFELPKQAFAAPGDYSDAAITGMMQPADVWFPEPVFEMCFRSDRYDQEITILQFEAAAPRFQAEEEVTDVFDQFIRTGQLPAR